MTRRKIFVTVGTTKFDELIKTILRPQLLRALSTKGYTHLVLQIGNTTLQPDCTPRCGFHCIEYFQLSPSINEHIKSSDLIISHAGAGSILEALDAKKHLIVVTNHQLMHNHQLELAEQLHKDEHLHYCTCETLHNAIRSLDFSKLKPFSGDKSKKIAHFINNAMGFT